MIACSVKSRPFYEFGVTGTSFRYFIGSFQKGFGFDTFSGLPEDWHNEKRAPIARLEDTRNSGEVYRWRV